MVFKKLFQVFNYIMYAIAALETIVGVGVVVLWLLAPSLKHEGSPWYIEMLASREIFILILLICIPLLISAFLTFKAGYTGLHGKIKECRWYGIVNLFFIGWIAVELYRNGYLNVVSVLQIAVYGTHFFLAHIDNPTNS